MKKVVVFAGSSSKKSINKQLAVFASSLLNDVEVKVLDLNDYPLPLYSEDAEVEDGFHNNVYQFKAALENADGYITSIAEHNGSYPVVFKNLIDWLSRVDYNIWQKKPTLLLTCSPGDRGAANSMAFAESYFPRMGADITGTLKFPNFHDNFKENRVVNEELADALHQEVKKLELAVLNGN